MKAELICTSYYLCRGIHLMEVLIITQGFCILAYSTRNFQRSTFVIL